MREIKFRGMDTNGEWHHGNLNVITFSRIDVSRGSYISNKAGTPFAYQVRPETVGQFSGLKDRNGKEIYEGDYVEDIHHDDTYFYCVEWNDEDGGFFFVDRLDGERFQGSDMNWNTCMITGNKYESPDLLGEEE